MTTWEKRARALLRVVVNENKRQGGVCPACGAERFQPCYTSCPVADAKALLGADLEPKTCEEAAETLDTVNRRLEHLEGDCPLSTRSLLAGGLSRMSVTLRGRS